ncbi:MAG: alpha-amylase [Candidatus Kapabacteria bacterium]|nr:alpha-amylase [Candidatus Kapabacteria bacterium]
MTGSLERLREELVRIDRFPPTPYCVPGLWVGSASPVIYPSASRYFIDVLDGLTSGTTQTVAKRPANGVMYNAMVRHVTSYEHGLEARTVGWRSTGTFLKMIALLPYLRELHVETIVLLPVSPIGAVGRKGQLGSPYAVRDPFAVEAALAEPLINLSPEQQARAFIEAAHRCGMKVLTEVVLRTASLDSVLVRDHPEWFYWIRSQDDGGEGFHAPVFSDHQVREIRRLIELGRRIDLPEPSAEYRRRFTEPPMDLYPSQGGWRGRTVDGEEVSLPGAFADWPPDDPQPAWDDVTYLKLHRHPMLNYMAYNTIRMFDTELEKPGMENAGVWNMIASVIPTTMRVLGADGAMVDMGHALPDRLRRRVIEDAKAERPDAVMIEENFHLDEASVRDGFDVVTGYLPFDAHDAGRLRSFIARVSDASVPVRYLACGESHNTPRWASRINPDLVPPTWALLSLLPKAVAFIVAGMELAETRPINTGLDFTPEEIALWTTDRLALFSDVPLPWDTSADRHAMFIAQIAAMNRLDVMYHLHDDDVVRSVECHDQDIVAFHRHCAGTRRGILVVLNTAAARTECSLDISDIPLAALAVSGTWGMSGQTVQCQIEAMSIVIIPTFIAP